ncbi:MAG: AsmA family protein [Bryobacteraceae bacterium]
MKRAVIIVVILLVVLALAGPFLPLGFLKPGIAGSLSKALGRRVDIDGVSVTLFPVPAFALNGVTISEDARAGVEPFVYAETVDAQVNLLGVVGAGQKFTRIRLTGAALNLVKTDAPGGPAGAASGPWNVQYLLGSAASAEVPAIQMRAGRVNVKFGQTKSVLYFDDTDLDISANDNGTVDLRFSGLPERTDRPAEAFGHFFVRGVIAPNGSQQQTNLRVEMEPTTLEGLTHLLGVMGYGLEGQVALDAQITGAAGKPLDIKGALEFRDDRPASVLPQFGGKARLGIQGIFDGALQALRISSVTTPKETFSVSAEATGFLARPQWAVLLELKEAPLAGIYGIARQIGISIPDKMAVAGTVSGNVRASSASLMTGELALTGISITPQGASEIKTDEAAVSISGDTIALKPVTLETGDNDGKQTVLVEASTKVGVQSEADVKISTRGLGAGTLQKLEVTGVPLLGSVPEGTLRGVLRFHHARTGENQWSGEYQLVNARVPMAGLAEPLQITTATVASTPEKTAATRIRAAIGKVAFSGEYSFEEAATHPHQFKIQMDSATGPEFEELLRPTLQRAGGFWERTLGIGGKSQLPAWLSSRRAEGTLSARSINIDGHAVAIESATLVWDGADVKIADVKGRVDSDAISGTLTVDLAGRAPKYHADGRLQKSAFKGGKVDVTGTADATGVGAALLTSLHAQGSFDGRGVAFAPEALFRTVMGKFDVRANAGALQWKLSAIEGAIGAETYTGEGASGPDGKITLSLSSGAKKAQFNGTLVPLSAQ